MISSWSVRRAGLSSHAELSSPHSGALMHDVHDIPARRLRHQQIAGPAGADAADVVRVFGAMQAQDYRNALWAVGLRTLHANRTSGSRTGNRSHVADARHAALSGSCGMCIGAVLDPRKANDVVLHIDGTEFR